MGRPGVLFDVDGTLVDTAYIHTLCWWEAFADHGIRPSMSTIHRAIGMGADRLIPHVLDGDRPDLAEAITQGHDERFAMWHDRVAPLPGASELLRECAHRALTVVLASSAGEQDLTAMRAVLDADDCVAAATSSSDAEDSKPSPDILLAGLTRAGLDPRRTVAVGDAVWDAEAALALDLVFIGVESGGTSSQELYAAGATLVVPDTLALLQEFDHSPLADIA